MDSSRNIYKEDVDSATLALQSPIFEAVGLPCRLFKSPLTFEASLKPNGQLDFSNPEAVQ
jgi:hypothetical protein